MAGTVDVGTGATMTFGTSSYAVEITGINLSGVSRAVIDTTHLGTTGARTKRPGDLYEPGTIQCEIHWDPDEQPPITGAEETVTLTFPIEAGNSSGASLAATGFISEFSAAVPLEDKMTGSYTVQLADDHTWTDGAV